MQQSLVSFTAFVGPEKDLLAQLCVWSHTAEQKTYAKK